MFRFSMMMNDPLESFFRLLETSLKDKAVNKLLHLLDVLGELHRLSPRFKALFKRELDQLGQFGKFMAFRYAYQRM